MKNVWILNHYAVTPDSPGGTRHYSLASNLNRLGWNCTVVASDTNHVTGVDEYPDLKKAHRTMHGNVEFLWLKTKEYRGSGIARIIGMIQYLVQVTRKKNILMPEPPDVVIGSSVHPLAALGGAILAKRHNVPFVFEIRDLWPETLIQMGRLESGSFLVAVLRRLERYLVSKAALVVTLLPNVSEYFDEYEMNPENIVWISNGVDLDHFPMTKKSGRNKPPLEVMYFGAHGQANGLELIVDAVKEFKDRHGSGKIRLRMIGDGPSKSALEVRARDLDLFESDIVFEPQILKSEIPQLAAGADAFVISVLDLPELYKYGISMNKIFDYLAAARPVLIASNSPNNPIKEANCGYVSPAGDPVALADNLALLVSLTKEQREQLGQSGRSYLADHYSYDVLSRRLDQALKSIIPSNL